MVMPAHELQADSHVAGLARPEIIMAVTFASLASSVVAPDIAGVVATSCTDGDA
jgi:hypothetical protein